LIIVLFRTNRRARAANRLLKEKNELIEQQTEQLRNLNATKDKLFAIIGHDLRGPLNSLRGMIDLLSKSIITQEEFIGYSEKIKNNVDFVYSDLENLLSWAQTQQKGIQTIFTQVNLKKVVDEKINLSQVNLDTKKLQVNVEVNPEMEVVADKNQLDLILRNLITNAIKFSYASGIIVIEAKPEPDNYIRVSITDTGIGMDPTEVEKIIHSNLHFSKPGTQNEKGMGLGLLLVKEFVELNQGKLNIQSKPGQGSTFSFTLRAN
jgi:two-component system sensor histidine kinase/response regulator